MRALTELKKECIKRLCRDHYSYDETCLYCRVECFICSESRIKRLVIHHKAYTENSVTYNKFENSDDGRLKYYVNLLDEIKVDITNFYPLCVNCHGIVETYIKNDEIFENSNKNYEFRMNYVIDRTIERQSLQSKKQREREIELEEKLTDEEVGEDWY